MTFFIRLENGQPASYAIVEENFRQLFPGMVFPNIFTAEFVEPLGYGIYDFSNQPQLDRYKKAVEVTPVRNELGVWRQTWQIVDMTAEEKDQVDKKQESQVRGQRNYMLFQCDWTRLDDVLLTESQRAAWATYRQALRDITAQPEFPWTVNWPVQPE